MPTWEQFLVPVLKVLNDGRERSRREMNTEVADAVGLTKLDRAEALNSGQLRYSNRIGWSLSFLARAEAISRPKRGSYVIAEVGRSLLDAKPSGITEADLKAIPAYVAYEPQQRSTPGNSAEVLSSTLDPIEQIEQGIARINEEVAAQLQKRLHDQEPAFLEQSVLDVLVAMGYGGAEKRAQRTQLSNDGGIDGIIDQDPLGLDRIYVQAKRYAADNTVDRPKVQAFVGALQGHQAMQGIFITTGRFSPGAREYAANVQSRVILIDGDRLTNLMIRYGIGVQTRDIHKVVEVDEDYFE